MGNSTINRHLEWPLRFVKIIIYHEVIVELGGLEVNPSNKIHPQLAEILTVSQLCQTKNEDPTPCQEEVSLLRICFQRSKP